MTETISNTGTPVPTPAPAGETPPAGTKPPEPVSFEKWFEAQSEEVKGHFEDQTRALKSALESERTQRKTLEKQLRDEAKKFEKGSDERKSLEEIAGKLAAAQSQVEFYDAAHKAGVSNLRLAYLAAQDAGLVDEKGQVDFEALKTTHPQLFAQPTRQPTPPGNAGAGTGGKPTTAPTMNTLIRRAAGYRS